MRKIVGLLLLFWGGSLLHASTLPALLTQLHTMQADFSQRVTNQQGETLQTAQGKMAMARPLLFRFETTTPNQQLIITNGKKIYVYDKDLEQVTINPMDKQMRETPALLLSDDVDSIQRKFQIKQYSKNKMAYYELTPKNKQADFSSILLQTQEDKIMGMQLRDNLGQVTYLNFSHVRWNNALSPTLFQFKAPKGVDVIEAPSQD